METEIINQEEENTSLEETLEVLKRNTKEIQDSMKNAVEAYQRIMKNTKEESKPFHEKKVRVHGALKVWAVHHGFLSELSIKDFLQIVFEDYGKGKRLDISQRTVKLDEAVAKLLGKSKDDIVDLGDFFLLVVSLFEAAGTKID